MRSRKSKRELWFSRSKKDVNIKICLYFFILQFFYSYFLPCTACNGSLKTLRKKSNNFSRVSQLQQNRLSCRLDIRVVGYLSYLYQLPPIHVRQNPIKNVLEMRQLHFKFFCGIDNKYN